MVLRTDLGRFATDRAELVHLVPNQMPSGVADAVFGFVGVVEVGRGIVEHVAGVVW